MKVTRGQLRKLIQEALKDVRYASRSDDGYQFSSQLPSAAQEELGQEILAGVGDVETLRNFFKDSLVDVNIIVVPDNVYQGMITALASKLGISLPDVFEADLDNSLIKKGLSWLSSKLRGVSKELGQVRAELSPDAYNMIIQRKDRKEASAFLFDLSWVTHDLIGHAFNFDGMNLSSVIDGLADLFTLGAAPSINPLSIGGTFDQTLKIGDRSMIGKSAVDKTIQDNLMADFERENFTPGVGRFDLGASVVGYYFIKGTFPPTIVNAAAEGEIDQDALKRMEEILITAIQNLKGKSGFVNFGDLAGD